jgi:tRNA (guanine-N7-)-methyltransferase
MDATNRPMARTFKPRRRRLGSQRSAVYERLAPHYALSEAGPVLDLDGVFEGRRPIIVEIGSGNGDLASSYAPAHPGVGLIAVDVHRPGIARLLADIDTGGLANLRVVEGDALIFLDRLPDSSIDEVWAFFPDPWPKNAQAHRRLVTPERIDAIARVLKPGGSLRLATDVESYARQMRRVLDGTTKFASVREERPSWRIETHFEREGREQGRVAVDLRATRQ